jgi:hypothetical protein
MIHRGGAENGEETQRDIEYPRNPLRFIGFLCASAVKKTSTTRASKVTNIFLQLLSDHYTQDRSDPKYVKDFLTSGC